MRLMPWVQVAAADNLPLLDHQLPHQQQPDVEQDLGEVADSYELHIVAAAENEHKASPTHVYFSTAARLAFMSAFVHLVDNQSESSHTLMFHAVGAGGCGPCLSH